jgi:hypothetical protein
MPEGVRTEGLRRFEATGYAAGLRTSGGSVASVIVSSTTGERAIAERIQQELHAAGISTWSVHEIGVGEDWQKRILAPLDGAAVFLPIVGAHGFGDGPFVSAEVERAISARIPVVPVLVQGDSDIATIADKTSSLTARLLSSGDLFFRVPMHNDNARAAGVARVVDYVASIVRSARPRIDPEDPQKGQWGGAAVRRGLVLDAEIREISKTWYEVRLWVESTSFDRALVGSVEFHLHPTFPESVVQVTAVNGRAELSCQAWGAFTVGAVADGGDTKLELDLAAVKTAPEKFRSR